MFWGRNVNDRIRFRVLVAGGQAELLPKCQRKWILSSAPTHTLNCYCMNTLHTPPKFLQKCCFQLGLRSKAIPVYKNRSRGPKTMGSRTPCFGSISPDTCTHLQSWKWASALMTSWIKQGNCISQRKLKCFYLTIKTKAITIHCNRQCD